MSHSNKKTVSRDFKGIWIPKEIWLFEGISNQEILLWAEIDSLYCKDKDGCFASNEYLRTFIGVKERRLQEMIHNLKSKGLLIQTGFNGRQRYLKAICPNECTSEVRKSAPLENRGAEKCTSQVQKNAPQVLKPHILIENKEENKVPPTPVGVVDDKSKKIAFKEQVFLSLDQHEKLLKEHGQKKLDWMLDTLNNYKCSKGVKYKSDYHTLIGWVHKRYNDEHKIVIGETAKHREGTKMAFESKPDNWKPKFANKGKVGDSNGVE